MPNKFETVLSSLGKAAKVSLKNFFTKILPAVVKVAQVAEPLVDLVVPAIGAEYNIVVNAVAQAEATGALAAGAGITGEQKMAMVIAAVTPQLLPVLTKQGITSEEAERKITQYAQAVVTILNTFPVVPPAPATATTATK